METSTYIYECAIYGYFKSSIPHSSNTYVHDIEYTKA